MTRRTCSSGVARGDDDLVEVVVVAGLEQQRDVGDRRRGSTAGQVGEPLADARGRPRDGRSLRVAARAFASAKTIRPSAGRSSAPSARARRRRTAPRSRPAPGVPGATATPRASASASIDGDAARGEALRGSRTCRSRCRRSARPAASACTCRRPALPDRRALRRGERVLQQHRDRQRPDAAGHRRQRAGDLRDRRDARRRRRSSRVARTSSRRFEPAPKSRSTTARSVTGVVPTSITVAPGLTNVAA